MSLSNEQRAHDITLMAMSYLLKTNALVVTDENGEYRVDLYAEYKSLYEMNLESVMRDFSDEQ